MGIINNPNAPSGTSVSTQDWTVENLTVTGDLVGVTGRRTTYVIAASDATDLEKNQADAVCSGSGDDVTIQAALDSYTNVYLTPGTYSTDAALTISTSHTHLLSAHGKIVPSGDFNALNISGAKTGWDVGTAIEGVVVSNLWLDGTNTADNKIGINIGSGVDNSIVENCFIENFVGDVTTNARGISAANWNRGLVIQNNFIRNCQHAIVVHRTTYTISNNICIDSVESSIYAEGDLTSGSIIGNIINGLTATPTDAGIKLITDSGIATITGNYVRNSGRNIYLYGAGVTESVVSNNVLDGGTPGIYIVLATDNIICHNIITGATGANGFGIYLYNAAYRNLIHGNSISLCSESGINDYSGYNYIDNNTCYNNGQSTVNPYGIWVRADYSTITNNRLFDNQVTPTQTSEFATSGSPTHLVIRDNDGFINGGEIRTATGSLTAGVANAITFAWHNPELQDILIRKVVVEITTGSVTATSVIDVGIADDAAGTNRGVEFFDDLDANDVDVNDSWVAGDGGTQTKHVLCQDSASATDGWVVGQILTADAAALVGKYYIEYAGR